MRNPLIFVGVVVTVFLLIDLYAFKGIRLLTESLSSIVKHTIHAIFWGITAIFLLGLLFAMGNGATMRDPKNVFWVHLLMGTSILIFVPKLVFIVFHGIDDLLNLCRTIAMKFYSGDSLQLKSSRLKFITQLGAIIAAVPFISIGYGIIRGRYNFKVKNHQLRFGNLPSAFSGLKVVHISDIHIGSFDNDHEAVQKGVDIINSLEPDLILFTGDLVNNKADETEGWEPVLGALKAKLGKYSVLGNHDYGDYVKWESEELKRENLKKLAHFHEKIGFRLLLDENVDIKLDSEKISLLGIQNWGAGGFAKYGDLEKAKKGSNDEEFQLLLSHDPSHWDHQVLGKTKIDLSLAGHTHGFQFGVDLGKFRYSPVQHRYPRWSGLYEEANQKLYVNQGFGFIGFPGRVGIMPEITCIELITA